MSNTVIEIKPSTYQQAILAWVAKGRGSAIVVAVAGSGKTKTVELSLPLIPEHQHVKLFAFNSSIAKELNLRIEKLRAATGCAYRNINASTFHSVGFGAICKRLGKPAQAIQTDARKCRRLFADLVGERQYELYHDFCTKLVGLAKGQGIGCLEADTVDNWYAIIKHHDLYLESEDADETTAIALARELLAESNKAALNGMIDFDDQLYLPLLWRLRIWQHDWVIVDEAQDSNPVRRALARLALKPGGRSMWLGDPGQGIYGFTGASADALDIIKREFNAIELPLTVCYRCGSAIVEQAQKIVPYIEAAPGAIRGQVTTESYEDAIKLLGPNDVVLCRQVAPIIDMAYDLIGRGIGCAVAGKEIGSGLVNLVNQMQAKGVETLVIKLSQFQEREVAKFTAKGEEHKAEAVSDRVACIMTVIEHLPENLRTIPKLVARMESLFSDHSGVLTLSSIHKAKGREWKRVAVLAPELSPSKWARQEWQYQQELNLMYVRDTRAEEHLIFMLPKLKKGGASPVPNGKGDDGHGVG